MLIFRLRFISFTFLIVTTFSLGCNIINKGENRLVKKLDPVVLTQDVIKKLDSVILTRNDLPSWQLRQEYTNLGPSKKSSVIVACHQRWRGGLTVRYWLFNASSAARDEAVWIGGTTGAGLHFKPESNPEEVIGDATWYHIDWKSSERRPTILFLQSNVLVLVHPRDPSSKGMQFSQNVARKIEAKIQVVLKKK